MNKKKILVMLRMAFASRTAHHALSLLLTGLMLGGIGLTLRADIEDIKLYVQSVLERDPNFKIIQESVNENMIRGKIDIETELVEEEEEAKNLVSNDTKNGYDSYTPKQPSQSSSNSSSSTTSSNSSSNNSNNKSDSTNSDSNNNKQEEIIDKSTFYGKDTIISEGQPFNPMNALQLYACDINGENITNSITITENNVDIYKPGIYNVKASIVLKNGKTLDKKFAVRVEPTVLDLAVNDVKISKTELKKEEDYTMNFAVNSSKSYIDVEKVVINKNEYEVKKVFEDDVERYSVDLVASHKAGNETLKLQKLIMSDKTIVDVDKVVNINVLKEDATLEDVIIKDESNENNTIGISFNLKDIDNTINETKICIYDEENNLVFEKKVFKNKYSSITKVSTKINLNKAGIYTVKVLANRNDEESEKYINELNSIELFSKDIAINMKEVSDEEDINLLPASLNEENEEVSTYSENNETKTLKSSIKEESKTYNVNISGYIANDKGELPAGTLQVEVPTSAAFIIDNKGNFKSSSITVRNNGMEKVDVYAYKFIDNDGERNINVRSMLLFDDTSNILRNELALYIYGNIQTAYLKTESAESNNNGVYADKALQIPTNKNDGVKISTLNPGVSDELKFVGITGRKSSGINTAIKNRFILILKIKKSTN